MAWLDIDRLASLSPSKFVDAMADQWPGVYERLYAKGHHTKEAIIAELRRQLQTGNGASSCQTRTKRKIGVEAAAQNDG